MMLSIVIPVLNEAAEIESALRALAPLRERGCEVIVVDGASNDGTVDIARPLAHRVIKAKRGRASQMNAGAAAASGDVLLFLHADTSLPDDADRIVREGIAHSGKLWGRFDVQFSQGALPLIATMMNLRSRATGIATGDQAMFVSRSAFEKAGGFPEIPLMEDIATSKTLKRFGPPLCLRAKVTTSPRRWHTRGVLRTVLLMWRLRLAYSFGAAPDRLARLYGYAPAEN
jgi:rSAM/selenodomain-associated transferase 2